MGIPGAPIPQDLLDDYPVLQVQIAFSTDPGAAPNYVDVTPFERGFSIRRGRGFELDTVQAGTATIKLDNSDRRFDPTFAGEIRNLVSNPSFETNLTGWGGAGGTLTRVAGGFLGGFRGSKASSGAGTVDTLYDLAISGDTAGLTYTTSIYVRGVGTTIGKTLTLYCEAAGGATGAENTQVGIVLTADWQRVESTHTLTANDRTSIRLMARWTAAGALEAVHFDAAQTELNALLLGAAASTYCDGDQDNCRWAGTAHASQSYFGGPYYPNVVPGRRVQINADYLIFYELFTGYIERWPGAERAGPELSYVTLECVDAFAQMADTKVSGSFSSGASDSVVGALLDAASWPAGDRTIGAGTATICAQTLDDATLLSELQAVANETEIGGLFIGSDGTLVFQGRNYRLLNFGIPQAIFSDLATPADPTLQARISAPFSSESVGLKNEIKATCPGGTEQVVSDATSIARYGPVKRTLTKAPLLTSNSLTLDYATYLLARYKDPDLRVPTIELHPRMDVGLWPSVLGFDLGTRIRVEDHPPPAGSAPQELEVHIDGIEHDVSRTTWVTRWLTTAADPDLYWQLDDALYSLLGQTTRLSF